MIPKVIHYIFGLREDFCGKPFTDFHLLNIVTACRLNPAYKIKVHYYYEPDCWQFRALHNFCEVIKLDSIPSTIAGKPVKWGEHACDYLRVNILLQEGGIYLDADVVCIKPFDDLLDFDCIMGLEYSGKTTWGLCNATILAKKGSEFLRLWKDNYDAHYINDSWNTDSVIVPYDLAVKNPKTIRTASPDFFFKYPWDSHGFTMMFKAVAPVDYAYTLHLYESRPGHYEELCKYTLENVSNMKSTLAYIYRKVVFKDENICYAEPGECIFL
jgi:hypothetical protein